MIDFLRSIQIDRISFWLGFLAGALFGILVAILKVYLPRLIRVMRTQIQSAREEISAGTESRLRNDMLRFAQKQHLAAALFSLDEIAITPHLMTPPPPTVPGGKIPAIDVVNLTIPYMPDWPEMAAVYHAPTITLVEALHGGANLIVIGRPGSGKTVALAHLASLIVRHDPEAGEYIDYLPILIHAADISPITETKTALDILIDAVTVNASVLTIPRLPSLIKSSLDNDRIIILLDGMDELHPENIAT